jgi:hypothetical protein
VNPGVGIAPPEAARPQIAGAGRICPADYRYPPSVFDRPAELATDVLYVAGGLYGNLSALDEIERLAAHERATVVFNGDFHWFDAEPGWFAEVARRVARHHAIRGNVETEIARAADIGAGCGCAYPASVNEDVVRRSNEILVDLRRTADVLPGSAQRLAALPMHLVAQVGGLRVGIVHGDATGLAGWSFAHDALHDPGAQPALDAIHRAARVDVFASTHTCLPAVRDFALRAGRLSVINNGAAGMPNFAGLRCGLISRIATTPSPHRRCYGIMRDGVSIDALPLDYDHDGFLDRFLARWPRGSAAHASYFERLMSGPDYRMAQARPAAAA